MRVACDTFIGSINIIKFDKIFKGQKMFRSLTWSGVQIL